MNPPLHRLVIKGLVGTLSLALAGGVIGCRGETPQPTLPPTPRAELSFDQALALLDNRPAWDERAPLNLPRHPWESALAGRVIALDPGHGGDAHRVGYKVGPTGVREAEMNLRVGLFLERLLTDAGAKVIMTRRSDVDLDLAARAAVANEADADLFISLHHNASGPEANYTTVWYHGDADAAGPSADVARYIAIEIGDALRTDAGKTSPTMSDLQMYDRGFGVLRPAKMTAVLTESSFYTNPDEEQRLDQPIYNLREAYAIYRGLCGYFRHGAPSAELSLTGSQLTAELDEDLPQWWGHELRGPLDVSVTVDGKAVAFERDGNVVRADVGASGTVRVRFRNAMGHVGVASTRQPEPTTRPTTTPTTTPATKPATKPSAASATPTHMAPWNDLPAIEFPITLVNQGTSGAIDHGLDLPPGSALTIAKVVDGKLHARHYYESGQMGFYPASTVKLVTAIALLDFLEKHDVSVDGDIQLGDEPRTSIRETLIVMIRDSGNDEFNTLQESVGFAETDALLKSWGVETGVIRRHFKRPRYNSSRPVKLWNAAGELVAELDARPAVDFPLNAKGGESNLFTTDDLVRVMAAAMQGPTRQKPGFDVLAEALRDSAGKFLGSQLSDRYAVYNKVGWWPPDGAYSDVAYIHDSKTDSDYYVAAYCNGPEKQEEYEPEEPRQVLGAAMARLMEMIDDGKVTF